MRKHVAGDNPVWHRRDHAGMDALVAAVPSVFDAAAHPPDERTAPL